MKIVECSKGSWNSSLNFIDDNGVFWDMITTNVAVKVLGI